MSDIFLSYGREDKERVMPLVEYFEKLGWSCFWDLEIPTGHRWDTEIQKELDAAKAVVVVWSSDSVQSEWVTIEATKGKERGILYPVLLDNVSIPLAFSLVQAANLVGWRGMESNPGLDQLVEDLSEILGQPELNTEEITHGVPREKREIHNRSVSHAKYPILKFVFLRLLTPRTRKIIFALMLTGVAGVALTLLFSSPSAIFNDLIKTNVSDDPSIASSRHSIVIGGKNFLESYLIVEIMGRFIESENPRLIVHRCYKLGQTTTLYPLLLRRKIDLYPEYTGTVLSQVLYRKEDEIRDKQMHSTEAINALLQQETKNDTVEWLAPFGYNSAWHLVMLRDRAKELGIAKISDISLLDRKSKRLTILSTPDFYEREDALPGLSKWYNFVLNTAYVSHHHKYDKLLHKEMDVTDGYGTDPELYENNSPFLILEDDKQFFTPYYAAPFANKLTLNQFPSIRTALQKLATQKITQDDIIKLITEGNKQQLAEKNLSESSSEQKKIKEIVDIWLSSKDPHYKPLRTVKYSRCPVR